MVTAGFIADKATIHRNITLNVETLLALLHSHACRVHRHYWFIYPLLNPDFRAASRVQSRLQIHGRCPTEATVGAGTDWGDMADSCARNTCTQNGKNKNTTN